MDRKRIPADWRKRMAAVRAKIATSFSALPKDIDPYFQTLDTEGFRFFLNCLVFFYHLFLIAASLVTVHIVLLNRDDRYL